MSIPSSPHIQLAESLLRFVDSSPTPFHATLSIKSKLEAAGFTELKEDQNWPDSAGKFFVVRGDSSIIAVKRGDKAPQDAGLAIVGAHTDSPCLKVKPTPELNKHSYQQLGVEVYGGALLNPWFDRDLSLAGKVNFVDDEGVLRSAIIDLKEPIAVIPSLAIHLDRSANKDRTVNPQTQMKPVFYIHEEKFDFKAWLLDIVNSQISATGTENKATSILDFNLSFYDTQPSSITGLHKQFVSAARLDNLLSCFVGLEAMLEVVESEHDKTCVLICNDHEEVGSRSDIGAAGNMLEQLLERLIPEAATRQIALSKSLMISADNAHGIHPNYADKHDDNHGPILNQGPVIKFDANQSYATSSDTSAQVRWLANRSTNEILLQTYVTRADMRCGSTIGPITSAKIGVKTIDIGVPTFAMHSIREMAGVVDLTYIKDLLSEFYSQ